MRSKILVLIALVGIAFIQDTFAKEGYEYWTESTYSLQNDMRAIGYSERLSKEIINECKSNAKDPRNCVIVASFIGKAESNAWRAKNGNNVFGQSGKRFNSQKDSVKDFVSKYNKFWFNQRNPSSFYSSSPSVKPKTYFCLSEHSSNSITHCPNGSKTAWYAYSRINGD